jgi:hypothetical protein
MQREQRAGDKFPDEITSQPDDQRFFDPVRRRHRRLGMQPRERPAGQPPDSAMAASGRRILSSAASRQLLQAAFSPAGGWAFRPAQNGQQQQPEINDSKRPRETENGKQKHLAENIAAEKNRRHAQIQLSNSSPPPNRSASKTARAKAAGRRAPPSRCQRREPRRRGATQRADQRRRLRLPSGSAFAARQFSHSSKPARFRMKSIRPMQTKQGYIVVVKSCFAGTI